jgi:hypothetical protein
MKNFGSSILAIALSMAMIGCAARQSTITNLPTGVTQTQVQKWDTAVKDLTTIANTVSTARQSILYLCTTEAPGATTTLIPTAACKAIATDFGKIDNIEIAAAGFLEGVPKTWNQTIATQVNQWTSQIAALLIDITANVASISNQSTVAEITGFVTTISTAVTEISGLL